ncbi:MAG: VanZ family protein [Pyrinomonadaceae bacterium]|nr:VanZ family protein [Pyrinomonadaceae bacterium]
MRIKILAVIYFLVLVGIIVIANNPQTAPLLRFVRDLPFGDKIGHFCLMGGFSFLLNLVLSARTFPIWRIQFLLGTVIALVIVTLEEFSQRWFKTRTFDVGDLLCDFAGILIFGEIARYLVNRNRVET